MLEEKLKFKNLADYQQEFCGENTLADAEKFYAEKGEAVLAAVNEEKAAMKKKIPPRQINCVSTNGLDTELVSKVLAKSLGPILCQTLLSYGLL